MSAAELQLAEIGGALIALGWRAATSEAPPVADDMKRLSDAFQAAEKQRKTDKQEIKRLTELAAFNKAGWHGWSKDLKDADKMQDEIDEGLRKLDSAVKLSGSRLEASLNLEKRITSYREALQKINCPDLPAEEMRRIAQDGIENA